VAGHAELGRAAFSRGSWRQAFEHLQSVEALDQADIERLAVAAQLVGEQRASELAWERAHRLAAERMDYDRAARAAFWLGFDLLLRGEEVRASGWLARAERTAADAPSGASAGLLLLPQFLGALGGGRLDDALDLSTRMSGRGRELGDDDLLAFGLLCEGEALAASGRVSDGMRRLDEAMVSITAGEVSPIATGVIYCAVIDACMHASDLKRASAWTEALSSWCRSDPSLVPFRGQCMVHRSQVLMAHGAWSEARQEAERALVHLAEHPALGDALYQQAELERLRGDLKAAEASYRAANSHGREPNPGLALLRLAQGRADAAAGAARRLLLDTGADPNRPAILAAVVEILVRVGAPNEAIAACDELGARAEAGGADLLSAMALIARGALALAQGDSTSAAAPVRAAIAQFRSLEMPYELARARMLMAEICTRIGDHDTAELEREAARDTFTSLGATTELSLLERPAAHSPLTARECEVIRLVAAGRTNREIAGELTISEHTVARHLQNIFVKLGVSSRAAATAYAYEHDIV
jgi:DNA-binding NarL/FixJ family response regulator